jgi:hypothetical protein
MKTLGCPAMEGICGVTEFPPGPWQPKQASCEIPAEQKKAVSRPAAHRPL